MLWLCRCGLSGLEGLSALPELQELYVAFNEVDSLACISEAEKLEILDLEANAVADLEQVEWLQLVPSLLEVTLRGNPVCDKTATFRADAIALMPNVQMLDDEPTSMLEIDDLGSPSYLVAALAGLEDLAEEEPGAEGGAVSSPAVGRGASAELGSPRRGLGSSSACGGDAAEPLDPEELRKQRQELRMVLDGIKYAEVGRVYDVAADGRSALCGGPGGGTRPSTAFPLLNAWTAARDAERDGQGSSVTRPGSAGSSRRPSTSGRGSTGSILSRPGSAFFRPGSAMGSSRPATGSSRATTALGSSHPRHLGPRLGGGDADRRVGRCSE